MPQGNLFRFEMPEPHDDKSCWNVFRPHQKIACEVVHQGVQDWFDHSDEFLRGQLEAGDEAACIASLIWRRAVEAFTDISDVHTCRSLNIRKLIVGNSLAVRFKRLDKELLVSPPKSLQSDAWYRNEPIDGFPDHLVRLNVGHTFIASGVGAVYLTWQSAPRQLGWVIPFTGEDGEGQLPVFDFTPGGPSIPPVPIVPRGDVKKKEGHGA